MNGRVLIFPAGMPRSLAFLEQAVQDGREVIGSSSLAYDPAQPRYPAWCHLPFVTDDGFGDALREAVQVHGISAVFTPNIVVWSYLNRVLGELCPGVSLLNSSPLDKEQLPYRQALAFARSAHDHAFDLATSTPPRPALDPLRTASIFHHAEQIPGMCDHEKIRALFAVCRYCPQGDVVEIGSWWGKSAFVLGSLARHHGIGPVLCVDPWSSAHLKQGDSKQLVDSIPVDTDEALTIFQINLMAYFHQSLNYLRLPSRDAAAVYASTRRVDTPAFGTTDYAGRIALLHIDGNHSYPSVQEDIAAWGGLVVPGGWVIFDDYVWPYGDGPQRVADEYVAAHASEIELCFAMGSALFVRKAGGAA